MQLQVRKTPRPCGLGQPISFSLGFECLSQLASQVYNPGPEMFGLLFPRHMATQSTNRSAAPPAHAVEWPPRSTANRSPGFRETGTSLDLSSSSPAALEGTE